MYFKLLAQLRITVQQYLIYSFSVPTFLVRPKVDPEPIPKTLTHYVRLEYTTYNIEGRPQTVPELRIKSRTLFSST